MEPLLIDKHALGELLSMGPDSARAFCERHGVHPVNVGLGKRSSLRWNREEVIQMVNTLQAKTKSARTKTEKPKHQIIGMSASALYQCVSGMQ